MGSLLLKGASCGCCSGGRFVGFVVELVWQGDAFSKRYPDVAELKGGGVKVLMGCQGRGDNHGIVTERPAIPFNS